MAQFTPPAGTGVSTSVIKHQVLAKGQG